ncbi:MAG: endopeptidase La [Muribaculum sp.]|nr:endopeptidase La [Muribaculum sp.]
MSNSNTETHKIISLGQIDLTSNRMTATPDYNVLPILPTRNLVLFPGTTIPISLVRINSQLTAQKASDAQMPIGIVCQVDSDDDNPTLERLYEYGVVADVLKVFDLPDGSHTAIVRARDKFIIEGPSDSDAVNNAFPLVAKVSPLKESKPRKNDKNFHGVLTAIRDITVKLAEGVDVAQDFLMNIKNFPLTADLVNFICTQSPFPVEIKMSLLVENQMKIRANRLLEQLTEQEQMMKVAEEIQSNARKNFEQNQRQAFLQGQMEAIKNELYGDEQDEVDALRARAETVKFTDAAKKVFDKEVDKLSRLNPQSPEYAVQYSYLETLLDLPWQTYSDLNADFGLAREVLDSAHYGLKKVKQRILEQIALLMNNPDGKSPILCLVGPPGVGKTSLGRSVADALGRKYQRVSLGGLHDEAEIRGHRRTYIGAMPGRIIDAVKRAGTSNPVLLLDEVDKIGSDFKGDPSAALLEVLDPEQNCRFHDNYIDIDYDLSKVLFIATANTLSTLSQPLLDRMEIIDLSGYLLEEKVQIAVRHIIPKLLEENNLSPKEFAVSEEAISMIVENYTSESGVRQLEKELANLIRKAILAKVQGTEFPVLILPEHLKELLGVAKYTKDRYEGNRFAGVVTGLAWTAVGGEILYIESSLSKSKGDKLTLTGNLGNVMKESAAIALQYIKSHAKELGIDDALFEKYQLHVHVPEGAIPKDGPSAGITMATSMVSAFTQRKVRPRLAMTGEITLRGKVLPVGGIKEKILAAKRAGITDIVLSSENRKDIEDIDSIYIDGLAFHYVDTVMEVIDYALLLEKVDDAMEL